MKNFLEKYNAAKLETNLDEGKLTLESAKKRILKLLEENMLNFKNDSWSLKNRMNKLMVDTEYNTIFTLRVGGKKIVRYSLELLDLQQKLNFLADFYTSVSNNEFDDDIVYFLAQEVENANNRKKEANDRRRIKIQEEREKKAEIVHERTLNASQLLLNEQQNQTIPMSILGQF